MPAVVAIPQVVEELLLQFGDIFPNEPARRHFAEYVTGLFIAEHKSVSGINREFAATTDQSCLNRFLTEAPWDVERINAHRLEWLQSDPTTRYRQDGVIAIDNTLIDHDGKLIEDAGWFWDHADERYLIAHDYLFANYVHPSGKHYPLHFRRFRKREECQERKTPFLSHTDLCIELIDWVVGEGIPGDITFDSYFTNAEIINHVHAKQRAYVGDLKANRTISVEGRDWKASDWIARQLLPACRKKITVAGCTQWYFSKSIRLPKVSHPVRIVVLWAAERADKVRKILITNRTYWEVHRVLKTYRKRWTGTETFHRDGKQHLGMGECQLRSGVGQTRHMHLVVLAYTALMRQLQHDRAQEWAKMRLTTIGEACRQIFRETLGKTLEWVVERAHEGLSVPEIKHQLALP
jgi:DDE superfamily endonuclease